jgi:hypothetical protein
MPQPVQSIIKPMDTYGNQMAQVPVPQKREEQPQKYQSNVGLTVNTQAKKTTSTFAPANYQSPAKVPTTNGAPNVLSPTKFQVNGNTVPMQNVPMKGMSPMLPGGQFFAQGQQIQPTASKPAYR